jgi:hypothetical protein
MAKPKTPPAGQSELDAELDEALEESFPASDPIAVHDPDLKEKRAAQLKKLRTKKKKAPTRKKARKAPARRKKTAPRRR